MDNFINHFKDLLFDSDPDSITIDTRFRDLEDWNSIMALSIIDMIDEEYGVEFNADDMKECQTLLDIFNRIKSKE